MAKNARENGVLKNRWLILKTGEARGISDRPSKCRKPFCIASCGWDRGGVPMGLLVSMKATGIRDYWQNVAITLIEAYGSPQEVNE